MGQDYRVSFGIMVRIRVRIKVSIIVRIRVSIIVRIRVRDPWWMASSAHLSGYVIVLLYSSSDRMYFSTEFNEMFLNSIVLIASL